MKWIKQVKGLDRLSLLSATFSLLGYFFVSIRDVHVIKYSNMWRTIFIIGAILGYLAGSSLGIVTLTVRKRKNRILTRKGKIIALMAIIIGLVGLSYIAFASYSLYKLRHV